MTSYRRARQVGGTWFFTLALAERTANTLLTDNIDALREAFRCVKKRYPFRMDAVVIMPDHLHCIWTLPDWDVDYSTRWGLIKAAFSRTIALAERLTASRVKGGERGIWQRRFWEHLIRDSEDYRRHVDYVHWNPVKHGWVKTVCDWRYSSFHRFVEKGVYPLDWGGEEVIEVSGMDFGE